MSESSKQKLRNLHPGEVLREEFLLPLGVTQYRLAKEIGVTEARISAICSGKRAITADTALRLAAFFGTTSGFWMGMQADYDIEEAAKELSGELAQIHRFEPMAAGVRESRFDKKGYTSKDDQDSPEYRRKQLGVGVRGKHYKQFKVDSMKAPISHSNDPDLQKVPQALMRASEKARQLAEQTGTTFVVRKSVSNVQASKKK